MRDKIRFIDGWHLFQSPTSKAVRKRKAQKTLVACGKSFEQIIKELNNG